MLGMNSSASNSGKKVISIVSLLGKAQVSGGTLARAGRIIRCSPKNPASIVATIIRKVKFTGGKLCSI